MLLQFDLKHIHKVNFYPSDNNFTQALLVLLVTNMISAASTEKTKTSGTGAKADAISTTEASSWSDWYFGK